LAGDNKPAIWSVAYLDEAVAAEILALPADMQGKLARITELLAAWGPQRVGMPYTRPLGDKLWEIRLSGRSGIARVIYAAAGGRRLVLLHAFVKKTEKTPPQVIALALRRARSMDR
jgi:phage-related protein